MSEADGAAPKPNAGILVPLSNDGVPPSAQDPIRIMIEILADERLSDSDKQILIRFSQDRFRNRRRMAHLCLNCIFIIILFLGVAAVTDAWTETSIMSKIKEVNTVISTIVAFLTGVVLAYIGAAALRPSS